MPRQRDMRRRLGLILRLFWVGLCTVPLAHYFLVRDAAPHDAVEVFGWSMLLLTFPAGYLAFLLVGWFVFAIHSVFAVWVPGSAQAFALWAGAGSAGYAQWFYLLPRLIRKARAVIRR